MKKVTLFFLISSSFFSCPSFALNGYELLDYCQVTLDIHDRNFGRVQKENEFLQGNKGGQCQGYLQSVYEMQALNKKRICTPENLDILQTAYFVVKYLKSHPQELCQPAVKLVMNAYRQYYACR